MTALLDTERRLLQAIETLGPRTRTLLVDTLDLSPDERTRRISELHADERSRTLAELLIDLEEAPAISTMLRGMIECGR